MSNNSQSISTDTQFNILTEIPSTQQILFTLVEEPWSLIRQKLVSLEQDGTSDFLLALMRCPPVQWLEIEKSVERIRTGTHIRRLYYNAESRFGIIKCIPGQEHEAMTGALGQLVYGLPLRQQDVCSTRSTMFVSANNSRKQADSSWRPRTRASDEWPSLVLEVGYSQSMGSLRHNARWWLESRSYILGSGAGYRRVNQVILIKILRPERRIILESWILGTPPRAPRITRNSGSWPGLRISTLQQPATTLTTTLNSNTYATTIQGPTSLTILWEALHDTPHPTGQGDLVLTAYQLQDFADTVWDTV